MKKESFNAYFWKWYSCVPASWAVPKPPSSWREFLYKNKLDKPYNFAYMQILSLGYCLCAILKRFIIQISSNIFVFYARVFLSFSKPMPVLVFTSWKHLLWGTTRTVHSIKVQNCFSMLIVHVHSVI